MYKRSMQLVAALLALCLTIAPAAAVTTDRSGQIMIRVGLASANSHVPTKELEAAHLTNNSGYGSGYRFGYYDSGLNFVELGRTKTGQDDVAVLKAVNLRYGRVASLNKDTYSSSLTSGTLVGCWHVRAGGSYGSFAEASQAAANYSSGFVAWIDGAYQVRVGSYASQEAAEAAVSSVSGAAGVVGASSYGLSVVKTGTNEILFQYDCGSSGRLAIQPDVTGAGETRTWFSGFKYRGGFQYHRRSGGNITVVNVLPLEDYVNGVICYEMGRNWPLEALKAQALCARTYVLKNLGKHDSYGFDICTTASCQVYHGMGSERPDYGPSAASMQAVRETAGMVIRYNGRLAETLYSSSFGGASEDAKYVWGTDTDTDCPYLRGVVDPYEADTDTINSHSTWTKTYTTAQLTQQLQKNGQGMGTTVDHLTLTYSDKGNVIQAVIHWANGQSNTINTGNIRSRFDVDSIRFTVNGTGTGPSVPETPDDPSAGVLYINGEEASSGTEGLYVISGAGTVTPIDGAPYTISGSGSQAPLEVPSSGGGGDHGTTVQPGNGTATVSGDTYTFHGGGWGHQVGMSQFGAYAMAKRGFSYDAIVKFYLPGVQVEKYGMR